MNLFRLHGFFLISAVDRLLPLACPLLFVLPELLLLIIFVIYINLPWFTLQAYQHRHRNRFLLRNQGKKYIFLMSLWVWWVHLLDEDYKYVLTRKFSTDDIMGAHRAIRQQCESNDHPQSAAAQVPTTAVTSAIWISTYLTNYVVWMAVSSPRTCSVLEFRASEQSHQNSFTTQGQTGTMTSTFSHLPASISSIYQSLPDCDLRAPSIVNTTVVDNLLCYVRLDNAEWLNRLSATISRRPPVQFSSIGKPSFLVKLFSSLVFGGGEGVGGNSLLFFCRRFFFNSTQSSDYPFYCLWSHFTFSV